MNDLPRARPVVAENGDPPLQALGGASWWWRMVGLLNGLPAGFGPTASLKGALRALPREKSRSKGRAHDELLVARHKRPRGRRGACEYRFSALRDIAAVARRSDSIFGLRLRAPARLPCSGVPPLEPVIAGISNGLHHGQPHERSAVHVEARRLSRKLGRRRSGADSGGLFFVFALPRPAARQSGCIPGGREKAIGLYTRLPPENRAAGRLANADRLDPAEHHPTPLHRGGLAPGADKDAIRPPPA